MSTTTTIHDALSITYPDGFNAMSAEELQAAYGIAYPSIWGIQDPERHVTLAIFWKDSNELLSHLVNTESLAKRDEKAMAKAMRNNGYACGGFFSTELAGCEAHGFRYRYTAANGTDQDAETIVFKHGKTCYTLYYYTRPATAEANRPMYEDVLASLAI